MRTWPPPPLQGLLSALAKGSSPPVALELEGHPSSSLSPGREGLLGPPASQGNGTGRQASKMEGVGELGPHQSFTGGHAGESHSRPSGVPPPEPGHRVPTTPSSPLFQATNKCAPKAQQSSSSCEQTKCCQPPQGGVCGPGSCRVGDTQGRGWPQDFDSIGGGRLHSCSRGLTGPLRERNRSCRCRAPEDIRPHVRQDDWKVEILGVGVSDEPEAARVRGRHISP